MPGGRAGDSALPERRLLQVPVAPAPDRHAGGLEARQRQRRHRRRHRHRRHQGRRPRRDQVRPRLQLRRQQRQRRRRPRPRHARRRHDRAVDQQRLGVAGVAYDARIMPLKVLSARGSGSVAGIAQAHPLGRRPRRQGHQHEPRRPVADGHAWRSAVKYAHDKGVVVVCAAGNDGRGQVGYPARYPGVIAVAATQFDESTTFYSNWGKEIDIAAPGGNTRVDQNGDGKPDGVLQNTIVPGNTVAERLLLVHGHVDGVAARRGRRRAGRRRGRDRSRRGREDPARHRAQAARARAADGRTRRRPLRRRHRRRAGGAARRRATARGAGELGLGRRGWRCWAGARAPARRRGRSSSASGSLAALVVGVVGPVLPAWACSRVVDARARGRRGVSSGGFADVAERRRSAAQPAGLQRARPARC